MSYTVDEITNKIILGDCIEELPKFPSNCVDFIMMSPQWPTGHVYYRQYHYEDYQTEYLAKWTPEVYRVLKDERILLMTMCGPFKAKGGIVRFPMVDLVKYFYDVGFQLIGLQEYGSNHIACFRKGEKTRLKFYNHKNGSPLFDEDKYIGAFHDEFAIEMIGNLSRPGDLVLNPFCGTGTTCRIAKNMERKYCGIEYLEDVYLRAKEAVKNG